MSGSTQTASFSQQRFQGRVLYILLVYMIYNIIYIYIYIILVLYVKVVVVVADVE